MTVDLTDPRTQYLLAMADDELVTGHRATHWTGFAPSIESDLAFSTLAQDEINHADLWYQVVLAGAGGDLGTVARSDVDALGLGRDPDRYRHAIICERPPGDFAFTLARHFLYDHFDAVRLDALTGSTDADVAAVATKLSHEERYHLEHADTWVRRIARTSDDARARLHAGFAAAWPGSLSLAEATPAEADLVGGIAPVASATLRERWLERVEPVLAELGLPGPPPEAADGGGRDGSHTDDWTEAWHEMTALYREHPGATW